MITETQALELPRRELDALVHETIGLKVARGVQCDYEHGYRDDDMGDVASSFTLSDFSDERVYYPIPAYSEEIAPAMQLVEKLADDGKIMVMIYDARAAEVHVGDDRERVVEAKVLDDPYRLPLAITIAFLKARGVVG